MYDEYDFWKEIGIDPDSIDYSNEYTPTNNEILESIGYVFDGTMSKDDAWYLPFMEELAPKGGSSDYDPGSFSITGAMMGTSQYGSDINNRAATYADRQGLAIANSESGSGGLLGYLEKAGGWIEKNKKLTELIAGGVAGAIGASERRKEREAISQNQLDQLRLQDQLKREAAQRYSDSIKGLTKPSGMLYSGPLKYKSGNRVYNDQGQLIKG